VSESLSTEERGQLEIVNAWIHLMRTRQDADSMVQAARDAEQRARDQAKKEGAALLAAAERDAWIAQHGSERLKKCVALGYSAECRGLYRDERLALEAPGYEWDPPGARAYKESEIRNPSAAALDELERQRATYPDAALLKIRRPADEDDEEPQWQEAIRIDGWDDLPWADAGRIAYLLVTS
jgi:hypothetical protein